jgi:uncharacterized membrane protein
LHAGLSAYDWLLFLHLLAAFAVVAAIVIYTFIIAISRGLDVPSDVVRLFRISRVADVLVAVGVVGVLVFGIWLAIERDEYHPWDGWVVAAIVLWVLFGAIGQRAGKVYEAARDRARALVAEGRDAPSAELNAMIRSSTGLALQLTAIVIVIAFLVDMIYKPGA